jgi:hypothetical protein
MALPPIPCLHVASIPPQRPAVLPAPAASMKSNFTVDDLLKLTHVCVDNNIFMLGHGKVGKTWEKVAKELQVLGVKHSVAVLHKKLSHLMMWHEVSNLLF